MIHFNGLDSSIKKFKMRGRWPNCEVCGPNPSITNVNEFDYATFCPPAVCNLLDIVKLPLENDLTVFEL